MGEGFREMVFLILDWENFKVKDRVSIGDIGVFVGKEIVFLYFI